ncbi:hypothetical protein CEP51_005353 [Fusarium floridanum]|uniref:Uncharacterized protein n=1 Tax=Fusarium floridanum TaxID=1325733 RepID=A0A428RX82_9HYPO|nr:hypothetical protein CEP51_005353 [Fusarium floridanum]
MTFLKLIRLLIGASLFTQATAGPGEDFANNLFSDLGPLLALFGERVTTQFLSQATGWADSILLAMAPLGIVTIIVSAIRVSGPPILKAIIGRARESRAVAEAELMSSTSGEVCELWSGQQIVRVMGKGPIREFIILFPEEQPNGAAQAGSVGQRDLCVMDLEQDSEKYFDIEPKPEESKADDDKYMRSQPVHDSVPEMTGEPIHTTQGDGYVAVDMEGGHTAHSNTPPSTQFRDHSPLPKDKRILIFRNTNTHTPNLTLNVGKHFHPSTLQGLAAVGVILQLGVIVYFGFITYFPSLRWRKDGGPVENYAFSCTAVGTILLVSGIFVCGHMVEKSTDETKYRPKGRACQLIWLQKSGTVNDQTFSSFAITPAKHQEVITTSSRSKTWQAETCNSRPDGTLDKNKGPEPNPKKNRLLFLGRTSEEVTTSLATFFAVSGFVLQFVGLRGMHWSASIGQLIATLIMTIIRVSIRKNLAVFPKSFSLHPEHELDWLALTLWSKDDDECCLMSSSSSSTNDGHDVSWQKSTQSPGWMDAICVDEKLLFSTEGHKLSTIDRQEPTTSTLNRVVQLRRDLGKLADWPGVASQEAISTARAIEIALGELSGTFEPGLRQAIGRLSWKMRIGNDWVTFHVEQSGRNWKALADEIDAVLSLWIYHIKCTKPSGHGVTPDLSTAEQDDSWLRTKGETPKRSLRLLGSSSKRLEQDLRWWVPDQEFLSVIPVDTGTAATKASNDFEYSIGCCEFTSQSQGLTFVPKDEGNTQKPEALAVETYDSLRTLLAQHIFSNFMFSLANTMSIPVPKQTTMKHLEPSIEAASPRWNQFSLYHDTISRLAQKIQATGFGSLESVYLNLIPPLSAANKLPEVGTVVHWTQQRAAIYEQQGDWAEAAEAYRWLFGTARSFPGRPILDKATALLLAFRCHVRWLFETEKEKLLGQRSYAQDLGKLLGELDNDWEREKPPETLTDLYHVLGLFLDVRTLIGFSKNWNKPPKHLETFLCFGAIHQQVVEDNFFVSRKDREHINEQDILGLTPLHYAIIFRASPIAGPFADNGAEINTPDIRGRTALHYLCRSKRPNDEWMNVMLSLGARIDVQDVDGVTPLHLAALHNLESHARLLLEAGANFNLLDKMGYSPLWWAVRGGAQQVAKMLLERLGQDGLDKTLERICDNHGRTTLHIAAMSDQAPFIGWLASLCDLSTLMQTEDSFVKTPIHLAAQAGKKDAVDRLVHLGSDTRAQDRFGETPMHLAAKNGHTDTVRRLLEVDGAKDLPESRVGRTPLHHAALGGHKDTAELLLNLKPDARRIYDDYGKTALHNAAMKGFNDMIDLLFEDQDAEKYDDETTPLHLATENGHFDTIKLLVAKGVSVNPLDNYDQTPLDLAIKWRYEKIVHFLLNQPDVRLEDKLGNTLLHFAARDGRLKISRMILDIKKEKIDVDSTNVNGDTPLHIAAENGHSDMVDFLIGVCKCDKTRRNNDGHEPLDVAEKEGHQNVVDLLVNKFGVTRHVNDRLGEEDGEDAP